MTVTAAMATRLCNVRLLLVFVRCLICIVAYYIIHAILMRRSWLLHITVDF